MYAKQICHATSRISPLWLSLLEPFSFLPPDNIPGFWCGDPAKYQHRNESYFFSMRILFLSIFWMLLYFHFSTLLPHQCHLQNISASKTRTKIGTLSPLKRVSRQIHLHACRWYSCLVNIGYTGQKPPWQPQNVVRIKELGDDPFTSMVLNC